VENCRKDLKQEALQLQRSLFFRFCSTIDSIHG